MAKAKMAATAAVCNTETGLPTEPLLVLWNEFERCVQANRWEDERYLEIKDDMNLTKVEACRALQRITDDKIAALEEVILWTPANSVEAVVRQFSVLATHIDNCRGDEPGGQLNIENSEKLRQFMEQIWLCVFGALRVLQPMVKKHRVGGYFYDNPEKGPLAEIGMHYAALTGNAPAIAEEAGL